MQQDRERLIRVREGTTDRPCAHIFIIISLFAQTAFLPAFPFPSHNQVGKFQPTPRGKMQELENLNLFFSHCGKAGIKFVNIDSLNVWEGSPTLILGLLWTIIYNFQVLKGYHGPPVGADGVKISARPSHPSGSSVSRFPLLTSAVGSPEVQWSHLLPHGT